MRETVGSTWTFSLVIVFISLFTTFLVLSINYSKAYRVKNEVVSILEKYEGYTNDYLSSNNINKGSEGIINGYLLSSSYTEKGSCPINANDKYYGVDDLSNPNGAVEAVKGHKYYYCIKQNISSDGISMYYNLILFYRFGLPFLGDIKEFQVTGTTGKIYYDRKVTNYVMG
jgi:hypothetical protein